MRKGWDAEHVTAVECAKACEQAGAVLIAVHARTREQMYTPGIDPSIIAAVKDAVHVPVLGTAISAPPRMLCGWWRRPAATA